VSFKLLGITHQFNAGVTTERSQAVYDRTEKHNYYFYKANEDVVCTENSTECIAGEQFVYYKKLYYKDKAEAEITLYDAYVDDVMTLGPFTLRPGIHASYNDLTQNTDYAPRLAFFYDLLQNKKTVLHAGVNRYYGKTLLTYKLREGIAPYDRYNRSTKLTSDNYPVGWPDLPSERRVALSRFASLDTPYVDEWSVGIDQEVFGGLFSLSYVSRDGEDLLGLTTFDANEDNIVYSEWNNNGESRHEEVTASWERQWQNHYCLVDVTWQDSESSNEDYGDSLEQEDLDEIVWYNGHKTYKINLPRSDYNREWSANLVYSVKLPYGFSFTNITRYRSGYKAIADTKENFDLPDGEKLDIYDDVSYPSSTTFDWKLAWAYSVTETQIMTITADVTNVFNRKLYTGVEDEYEMGRQLWVGIDYTF